MANLSANHLEFVRQMGIDAEAAGYGFGQLATHPKGADFFEALEQAGLLAVVPSPNSGGVAPGPATLLSNRVFDYLLAMARVAEATGAARLGEDVARITLSISQALARQAEQAHNHYSQTKYVEILSALSEASMTEALFDELPAWMGDTDGSHVLHIINGRLLPRLFAATDARLTSRVEMVLAFCTAVTWTEKPGGHREEPVTVLDHYFVNELLSRHSAASVTRLGAPVVKLLRGRVREVFSGDARRSVSWPYRPAIEDHEQNMPWRNAENMFVEALRDGLLAWVAHGEPSATDVLVDMYRTGEPIERRVAIHVFNVAYDTLAPAFLPILDAGLIDDNNLHETYHFLEDRYARLPAAVQAKFAGYVSAPHGQEADSIEALRALRMERNWLSAIAGRGHAPADQRFQTLVAMPKVGPVLDNPDFFSYHTTFTGPGPSPYRVDEVLAFLRNGTLIEKLNSFQEDPRNFFGTTTRALVDVLEAAIRDAPEEFLACLDQFDQVPRAYQYSVIAGFQSLWNAAGNSQGVQQAAFDWAIAWPSLLNWCQSLLTPAFWAETPPEGGGLTPNRDWLPGLMAELIKEGARLDAHAFAPAHLPKASAVLAALLEGLPVSIGEPDSDPMHLVLNTSRGRVLNAMITLSLRWCRHLDQAKVDHSEAWATLEPIWTAELAATNDQNFEFSTFSANYFSHFHYMNSAWVRANAGEILSPGPDNNFRCAMAGLVHADANGVIYDALVATGALDRALALADLDETPRERLIQRITLGYLWGKEPIDGPRMTALLTPGREGDLISLLTFMWSIGNQPLDANMQAAIVDYWRKATDAALTGLALHANLRAAAAKLVIYLTTLDEADTARLVALAPSANAHHSSYFFVKELARLVVGHPQPVGQIAVAYLAANGAEYDFESLWLTITTALIHSGCNHEALKVCEIMRHQPGFDTLYASLRR